VLPAWFMRHRVASVATAAVVVAAAIIAASVLAAGHESDPTRELTAGPSKYVAPTGSPSGDGSRERPLDLATALSAAGQVTPGMTLWLREGTYRGSFVSELTGTEQKPIVVRPFPGERVTIDSAPSSQPALLVRGSWVTFRGFEVMSSGWLRQSAEAGQSQPTDLQRGAGIEVHGPHTKFVNLVVHDLTDGFGVWSDAEGAEVYGSIVYHNGWKTEGASNGHGIYTQNKTGLRRIADNIIFNQFAAGIHAYGTDSAFLDDIRLEGNVSFNNGLLAKRYNRNILLGGAAVAHRPVLHGNHTFFTSGRGLSSGQNNLGYLSGCADMDVRGNYMVAGELGFALELVNCAGTVADNTFVGEVRGIDGKVIVNHPEVKERYPGNKYLEHAPAGVEVFVRPNAYEPGRANIIVYNWEQRPTIAVDLTGAGLAMGAAYEIRDAQNFFGPPVAYGSYTGGTATLRMTDLKVSPPIGQDLAVPAHTGPTFAVFVVVPSHAPSLLQRLTAVLRPAG
jgi:hypothetical protein